MNTNAPTDPRKRQQAIDRAVARAIEMAAAGVTPVLNRSETARDGLSTLQRWTVPSRTTVGTLYSITLLADSDGLTTECSCQAGESGKPCWHRALARLAALHEAPYRDGRRPAITLADLHGTAGLDPWPASDDAEAYAAIA